MSRLSGIALLLAPVIALAAGVIPIEAATSAHEDRRVASEAAATANLVATDARADALEAARAFASLISAADSLLVASRPIAALPAGVVDAQAQSELTSLQNAVDRFLPMPQPFLVRYPAEGVMPAATLGWAASVERIAQRQAVSSGHLGAALSALASGLSRAASTITSSSEALLARAPLASAASRSQVQAVALTASRVVDRGIDPMPVLLVWASAAAAVTGSQAEAEATAAAAAAAAAAADDSAASGGDRPRSSEPLIFVQLPEGARPTITANALESVMCPGYAGWNWVKSVSLPNGGSYYIDESTPFHWVMWYSVREWSLQIAYCTNEPPVYS